MELTERQLDNFWAKVDKTNKCWNWAGSKTVCGYGRVRLQGVLKLPHRISYLLSGKEIPEGYVVDHICWNKSCVNPAHLRAVTVSDNLRNRDPRNSNYIKRLVIAPHIRPLLALESDQDKLVNDLLAKHYKQPLTKKAK